MEIQTATLKQNRRMYRISDKQSGRVIGYQTAASAASAVRLFVRQHEWERKNVDNGLPLLRQTDCGAELSKN